MLLFNSAAAQTHVFSVHNAPALLVAGGLAGAETIALMVYNGTSYQAAKDIAGAASVCSTTFTNIALSAPGDYRLDKGITAGAVSVTLTQNG